MNWHAERQQVGPLNCTIASLGSAPTKSIILCHGYGAPGDNLVGLAPQLAATLDSPEDYQFVFPIAPLSPIEMRDFGGRAWWEINMQKLLQASESGTFSELHDKTPPGIEQATQLLIQCVTQLLDSTKGIRAWALGGFSQGAMLTMNAVLASPMPTPDLLVQFSGTLVCENQWLDGLRSGRLSRTPVFQSHGRQDFILPFSSAQALHDRLVSQEVETQFVPFDGPHAIPDEPIHQLAMTLNRLFSD